MTGAYSEDGQGSDSGLLIHGAFGRQLNYRLHTSTVMTTTAPPPSGLNGSLPTMSTEWMCGVLVLGEMLGSVSLTSRVDPGVQKLGSYSIIL
jgi:hypothetical protein